MVFDQKPSQFFHLPNINFELGNCLIDKNWLELSAFTFLIYMTVLNKKPYLTINYNSVGS